MVGANPRGGGAAAGGGSNTSLSTAKTQAQEDKRKQARIAKSTSDSIDALLKKVINGCSGSNIPAQLMSFYGKVGVKVAHMSGLPIVVYQPNNQLCDVDYGARLWLHGPPQHAVHSSVRNREDGEIKQDLLNDLNRV